MSKEKSIFKFDRDWWNNACISQFDDLTAAYLRGYEKAAEVLLNHVKNERADLDTLIFPIIFIHRHYFEILLKDIIRLENDLLEIEEKTSLNHKLTELWSMVKKKIQKIEPSFSSSKESKTIGSTIAELSKADPFSTNFRYPKAAKTSKSKPAYINVRHFAETLNDSLRILRGIRFMLITYLENLTEG